MKKTVNKKTTKQHVSVNNDTIVAISTALNASAIGIVRLSGPEAIRIVKRMFKPSGKKNVLKQPMRSLLHGHICDKKKIIDEVLVSLMRAPKTYTVEDVVEINCHGGVAALRNTLRLALSNGARMAEPGEFTKRAYLNGRIDLLQAEAVSDIIQAKSDLALRQAHNQLGGRLSKTINQIREELVGVLAQLQATLDFSDEDIETETRDVLLHKINNVSVRVADLIKTKEKGRLVRDGFKVAIVGAPNVGKSSLLNALLDKERAIVTAQAGTTRDLIEESLNINGLALVLQDTAGIRSAKEEVEQIGINVSKKALKDADLALIVFDASKKLNNADKKIIDLAKDKRVIGILNKSDLKEKLTKQDLKPLGIKTAISISALSGKGIESLVNKTAETCLKSDLLSENVVVSNERQIVSLEKGLEHIKKSELLLKNKEPEEIITIELREAVHGLELIVGEVTGDEILDKIFSTFCIGK